MSKRFWLISAWWVAWAVAIEFGTSRIVSHAGDPLQRARAILEPRPDIGWRQRPNLDTLFEGKRVVTNSDGFRIATPRAETTAADSIVLGPSSAFGWGVEANETYVSYLEKNLGWRTLNLSQIGYALVQGKRLYQTLAARQAPWRNVLIAYGVNDLDRYRFYGSDGKSDIEHFGKTNPISIFENLLNRLSLTSLVFRAVQESEIYWRCGVTKTPSLRTGLTDFSAELRAWIIDLKSAGKNVVLVNSAHRMPFVDDAELAKLSNQSWKDAESAAAIGDCGASRSHMRQARRLEPWRVLRDLRSLNRLIGEVGRELAVPVADLESALAESTATTELFVDPIHPSAKGHRLAALEIERALKNERSSK